MEYNKVTWEKIQLKFKSKLLWTNKSRLGRGQNNRPNHKKNKKKIKRITT
jgi:hypothetical protein